MVADHLSALDPRGPVAAEMTFLFWVLVTLGAAVFAGFIVLLLIGLFRRSEQSEPGDEALERRFLVSGGLAMPAVIIAVAFGFTLAGMRAIHLEPGDLTVTVVGHQWWWEVRYDGFTTANEIVIPAGEPVLFELVSEDVIHSFWVPELGGKIDLLPDKTNTVVLQADAPGEYAGACGEFCGLQHARMRFRVVAVTPAEFQRWVDHQQRSAPDPHGALAVRGLDVFGDEGCGECHTIRGTSADGVGGPDLTHLASRETLAAATLPNDPNQLAEWIRSPQDLKQGVSMPATTLSDADMEALIAYLETLR
jgi:cytochrome c oxidase subunit II